MKSPIILVLLVFSAVFWSCCACAQTLTYEEKSTGLNAPAMEEGDTEFEFGDVDGDGHVDIVSVGDHGSPFVNSGEHGVMVWFGDGAGTWTVAQYGDFGYGGVALGDVNGDGSMDVGYGVHHNYSGVDLGDQLIEVALGNGSGTFWVPWDDGLATTGEDWGMFGTEFADVDNDGDLDLGSVSFGGSNGARVYLNEQDGTWQHATSVNVGASQRMCFGDVNADGFIDMAMEWGDHTIFFGDGEGGFSPGESGALVAAGRRGVSLGDVDADGRDDLCFVNGDGGLQVWRLSETQIWEDLSLGLPASGDYVLSQLVDMDLDGYGDVVAYEFQYGDAGSLVVFLRGSGGLWQEHSRFATPVVHDYAALRTGADCDHNGFPDILLVAKENQGVFPFPWINYPRLFCEDSVPTGLSVHLVHPRGGEIFPSGAVRFIRWLAAIPSGHPDVNVWLSTQGQLGPFSLVAENLPNNGCLQWVVPEIATSHDCFVKVELVGTGVSAIHSGAFSIEGQEVSLPGDFDGNGRIDILDLSFCVLSIGSCPSPPDPCPSDVDGDGDVDGDDLRLLVSTWRHQLIK